MDKRRIYLGLSVVLISIISISSLSIDSSNTIDTYSLRRVNEAIISSPEDRGMIVMDDRLFARDKSEKILEELAAELSLEENVIEEIVMKEDIVVEKIIEEKLTVDQTIKEELVVAKNTEESHKPLPTPSRGVSSIDNRDIKEDLSKHLNDYVLDVVKSYKLTNGNYPYLLNDDFQNYNGVTEDLYYQGNLMLKANPNGNKASHCTGITFEVFFKAMQNRNKDLGIDVNNFNGMSIEELQDFMLTWYVALGSKSESNLAVAIEKYGLGSRITNMEDLRSGDFIDLSRENNTGHAVIFINWIRAGNKIIGLKYWSSQGSTKGISYKEEYFNIKGSNGQKYGNVRMDNLHMVRVSSVNDYKKY